MLADIDFSSVWPAMLPLEQNELASDADWHSLKTTLVVCLHCSSADAESSFDQLPDHLQAHRHGVRIQAYLATRDRASLDAAAVELTQRELSDAWLLLERL